MYRGPSCVIDLGTNAKNHPHKTHVLEKYALNMTLEEEPFWIYF